MCDISIKKRSVSLDFIKGIAIIAVVLYHYGGAYAPYGYLGVDVFFVVGGFLLIKSLYRQFQEESFNYWKFIFRKLVRLWPLIILACILAMIIGFFVMLPDDYENLSESVIASSVFSNNILQCITTKNYWNIVNLYKPLMHLWYVGLLMQLYIIVPLIYLIVLKIIKNKRIGMITCTVILTTISLALYLLPFFGDAQKFYYPPFRIFEFTIGGLLVFFNKNISDIWRRILLIISFVVLCILLFTRVNIISNTLMVIVTVVVSMIFIYSTIDYSPKGIVGKIFDFVACIGIRSYSIYIWHQVIIAFIFYVFVDKASIMSLLICIVITTMVSILSYRHIEVPLGRTIGNKNNEKKIIIGSIILAIIISTISFFVYRNAGVVRDVPELDVYKDDVHKGMHAEYNDRPYKWDKEFTNDGRIKVLVLGNSFGRDWANILNEWDKNNKLDIVYLFKILDEELDEYSDIISEADYVFFAFGGGIQSVPKCIPEDKLYVIGDKSYGTSNGIIYNHRFSDDYYGQTVPVEDELKECNARLRDQYKERYIDLMVPVMASPYSAYVFTDNYKFISQDCKHLTEEGSKYYARILDIASIFEMIK